MQNERFVLVDDVQTIKDHWCPYCDYKKARIFVDFDDDTLPLPDDEGQLQYFCPNCGKIFSIEPASILVRS